jgi:hypothetical protein
LSAYRRLRSFVAAVNGISIATLKKMTITEIIPTVKGLSSTDKLLLLQVLVQELLQAEGIDGNKLLNDGLPELVPSAETDAEEDEDDFTLAERIAFLKKPLAERRRIMAEQAEAMQPFYEQNSEWKDWPVDDIVEY